RADAVAARLQWRRSASFPARLRRRAALLYYHPRGPGGRHGLGEAARLFPVLCADAFAAYYATPRVWRWLGYDGPPMPEGYPSLTAARGEP
ncbi:MAG TPA: hypothetical protein VNO23_14790, partial [Candidatus Binatia bacterium]|nr:hypothetical protein [Candidatus Binatia bacterium]